MLWAGKGQNELDLLSDHIVHRMRSWDEKLSNSALANDQDLGSLVDPPSPNHKVHTSDLMVSDPKLNGSDRRWDVAIRTYDLSDHVPMYSIGLIRLIRDCLQYHPDQRLDLLLMKERTDSAIARLDDLYGGEIQKPRRDANDSHRVVVEDKKWSAFNIGQEYMPPKAIKRRRLSLNPETKADKYNKYNEIVEDWSQISTRPSLEQQAKAIIAVETWLETRPNKYHFDDEPRLRPCFQHLRACIMHRVAPSEPTHVATKWTELMTQSFNPVMRRDLATLIFHTVVSKLLEDDTLSDLHDTLHVMSHAAKWGEILVRCTFEPKSPALNEKTELHRGFHDWVMIQPRGTNIISDSE
jgi:hypothetical protein